MLIALKCTSETKDSVTIKGQLSDDKHNGECLTNGKIDTDTGQRRLVRRRRGKKKENGRFTLY